MLFLYKFRGNNRAQYSQALKINQTILKELPIVKISRDCTRFPIIEALTFTENLASRGDTHD